MNSVRAATGRRGQPLWALGGVLVCWIALRAALFESPTAQPHTLRETAAEMIPLTRSVVTRRMAPIQPGISPAGGKNAAQPAFASAAGPVVLGPRAPSLLNPSPASPIAPDRGQRAAGHNLLWMAAMGAMPLLPEVAAALAGTQPAPVAGRAPVTRQRTGQWSADAWLVWRPGSRPLGPVGLVTPVYGASQAGAVLRYDLAPASRGRTSAYIRAVGALEGRPEQDFAAGLELRPLSGLPVNAHGELRLSRRESGTTLRPAAFLSGGVDDAPLAAGITARGHAQAGYVGGREATAFADGNLIAEKSVWRARDSVLTTGAGVWGGAQRGAARLDLGPTASLRFRLGATAARLSADYRLRVAGNAQPASGAALTLSAGF